MKFWIRFFVILAHVVVIGAVVGPCRPGGCRFSMPSPRRGTTSEPESEAVTERERDSDRTGPERQQLPPEPLPERVVYHEGFFSPAIRPLPEDLDAASEVCRTGVVVDWSARRMLWGKKASSQVPIASLTKMMTVLLLMEAMDERTDLSLDKQIDVTRTAADIGGRQVWLDPRETFSVEDLLRCVLIHSANDAAYLVAEVVAGSEDVFVTRMSKRAEDLGLNSLTFHNSHGLPAGPARTENMGSAIELAFLAGRLLDYDEVTEWSSTRLSYLGPRLNGKKTQLLNTNKLVGHVPGVNGMKTGYTNKSGYCLAATCERNGRSVIAVVTGCSRGSKRDDLVAGLIEWAFANP